MLSPISSDLWVWMVGDAAIQLPQGFWWSGKMFLPARKRLCSFYLAMSNSSVLLLWFSAFRGHFWPASCPTDANGIGGLKYFPLRWVRSGSCFKGTSLCSGEFMPFFTPCALRLGCLDPEAHEAASGSWFGCGLAVPEHQPGWSAFWTASPGRQGDLCSFRILFFRSVLLGLMAQLVLL